MGVDLRNIITKEKTSLLEISGKVLAIDAFNALYQFLSVIRGEWGKPLMDRKGRTTSHLSGLFYRNMKLLEKDIKLVYVFDGKSPELKSKEIEHRRAKKKDATIKYQKALKTRKIEDAQKYAKMTSILSENMIEEVKNLLNLMGIPWVQAPSEGEAQAAYMTTKGKVWAVVSQDQDSLLFGAKRLLRNITISGRKKIPRKNAYMAIQPEQIELDKLLKSLEITKEQLVDIGILVGTDFNPEGFEGIGPIKALKYIKRYGSLENIPNLKKQLNDLNFQMIREIFLNPTITDSYELHWKKPEIEGLIQFLCHERDFSEERVRSTLEKLESFEKKRNESLERWL